MYSYMRKNRSSLPTTPASHHFLIPRTLIYTSATASFMLFTYSPM